MKVKEFFFLFHETENEKNRKWHGPNDGTEKRSYYFSWKCLLSETMVVKEKRKEMTVMRIWKDFSGNWEKKLRK